MKFFIVSPWGDCMFLARLLQAEGHEVMLCTEHAEAADVGRGLVPITRRFAPPGTDWVMLLDGPDQGRRGAQLRAAGYRTIGGNVLDKKLESQRGAALRLLERAGVATPTTKRFTAFGEAVRYLERQRDGKFYFKPEGEFSCALSMGGSAELLLRFLRWARDQPELRKLPAFIVQHQVEGVEVSTEGWFDGERWVLPFNGTFEEKHFLPGPPGSRGLGPRTGCQSNVVWTYAGDTPPLPAATVMQITEDLEEARYVGPIDINAIVDRHGEAHALEVTPRFGFDALQAFTALLEEGTVGEQLAAFADGELEAFALDGRPLAATLRVSIPPAPVDPAEHPKIAQRMRGWPYDSRMLEFPARYLLEDAMRDGTELVCAGRDGSVGVIVAVGEDLDELADELLQTAEDLEIPDKQYRTDPPVGRAEKDWRRLRALGLLVGPPERAEEQERGEAGDDDDQGDDGGAASTLIEEDSGGDDTPHSRFGP